MHAGSAAAEPPSGPPVVVTPEELRAHGIDRVRIIPRVRQPAVSTSTSADAQVVTGDPASCVGQADLSRYF